MLLVKYITKELNKIFAFILFVLLIVMLSKRVAASISQVATDVISLDIVCKVLFLYVPEILMQVLPLAWLLAVLLLHQKMYTCGEYIAILVVGFAKTRMMKIIVMQSIIIAIISLLINLAYLPKIVTIRENLLACGVQESMAKSIEPGRFKILDGGRQVFFIEKIDSKENSYERIFIAQLEKAVANKQIVVMTAQKGIVMKTKDKAYHMLLSNGQRYTGIPGKLEYNIMEFKEYNRTFFQGLPRLSGFERRQPTRLLWQYAIQKHNNWDKRLGLSELQWRFSLPIATVILTFIALGLTRFRSRMTSLVFLVSGVIIYLVYVNLLSVAKMFIKNSLLVQAKFAFIPIHLLFLLIGLFCIKRAQRIV